MTIGDDDVFKKGPGILWNAVFNVPQGLTMTIAISWFLGQMSVAAITKTFACAYCAGVMLTLFLNIPRFGRTAACLAHTDNSAFGQYIVSNLAGGALMGMLMNLVMTVMAIGLATGFFAAFWHTLPLSVSVSALSSCAWAWMVNRLVAEVYGQ